MIRRLPQSGREHRPNPPKNKGARHAAIRRVIQAHPVGTQDDLGKLLEAEGFHVTQATLSRDLAELRALRVARPEGAIYELEAPADPRPPERADLVLSIQDNDALCVVRTVEGAAPAVARVIDLARLPESLGTIAGDDTIFVTPVRGTPARRLSHALRTLLTRG